MASLVQDVRLGWDPRRRGRRLAPWKEPVVVAGHGLGGWLALALAAGFARPTTRGGPA